MSDIAKQVHNRFKVFAGALEPGHRIDALAHQVAEFARTSGVAAKSIGVEYVESAARLVVTLGYRDDEPGYPIALHSVSLGKIELGASDFSALEAKMAAAAAQHANIICHELFVTEDRDFLMVFMTHQ